MIPGLTTGSIERHTEETWNHKEARDMQWNTMDRSSFSVCDIGDEESDLTYWLGRPPEERLAAIEFMRQMMYGYDPTTARMERVLEIDDLA